MPTILSGSLKGGSGKTTLAVNLAVMRVRAGHSVLLVDADPQESASMWASVRSEFKELPTIVCVIKRGRIGRDVLEMRSRFDTIIIDAGGRDSVELRNALAICDMTLVTVKPSQFDTWSLDHMAMLLREIEERTNVRPPALVLLNAVNANPQLKEVDEVREVISDYADVLPMMPGRVSDRVSFRRAARDGMGVVELQGRFADKSGVAEMQAVYGVLFP